MADNGKWITINGRHVLIKDGQSPIDALIRDSAQKKNDDKEVERRERATRMYLDGEIDKSELIEDYFGGNKEGAEEYIKDIETQEYEYNLYKKAREDESSIDPMTEWSTDWEALDKKYSKRYEKEIEDNEFETVSKELQNIAKRTGKSDYLSEAGQRWNKLYTENKNNVSKDLGDNYKMSVGYGGTVYMKSSHPYDNTNYAYAEKVGNKWEVINPVNKERKMFNSSAEALEEMKNIDNYIRTGERVMDNEGVSRYKKPNDTWLRNAFNEYKKQHPGTKLTLEDFKKQNK